LKANFKIKKDDEEEKTIKQRDTKPRKMTQEEFDVSGHNLWSFRANSRGKRK